LTFHALVLAAGKASRFGGSKLTAAWQDGQIIDAAIAIARAAPIASVIVVTGAHARAVEAAVERVAALPGAALTTTHCHEYFLGMGASLRTGLCALPKTADGAFVFLGDMPAIPDGLTTLMLAELTPSRLAVVPVVGDRLGHPVLLRRALFDIFGTDGGDRRGHAILRNLGDQLGLIVLPDDAIFTDIDTPDDLARVNIANEAAQTRGRL
jgi:molybdenum cofactor cytidylyltransferase